MNVHPVVLTFVRGFFEGNPSIPAEIPSKVSQRKFNELIEFSAILANTPPPKAVLDALSPTILQYLVQASLIAGAHLAATQLLAIPGNKLPEDWTTPTINTGDEEFTTAVLPGTAGVRVTHVASGLSAQSTSETTLEKDREKALTALKAALAAQASTTKTAKPKSNRLVDPNTPRGAMINKLIQEVFAKNGGPESPEQMHAIQQRISKLLGKLDLKAEIGCILMPDGVDPDTWAALIPEFNDAQMTMLKKLTDAGDQNEIQKFFEAALAAKKAG